MKKRKREKTSFMFWLLFVIISLLYLFAFGCMIYVIVMQGILSYEKFGVIISQNVFIPHKSTWWLLGMLAMLPAYLLTNLLEKF